MKNKDVTFDDLLDRLWTLDFEVLPYEWLMVCVNYRTKERVYFHNSPRNDVWEWLNKENPIFVTYNGKGYDQYILKGVLTGFDTRDLKQLNDYIIVHRGNGWEFEYPEKVDIPTIWDLMGQVKTFKSLKELEANLGLSIVESKVDFNVDHKLNKEEFEDLLYYCTADNMALIPIFEFQMKSYKSKFVIAKFGNINPEYALSLTDANLTATLLGAEKKEHNDNFKYVYPEQVQKEKIPKEFLDYIDDMIEHNDLNYKPKAPELDLGSIIFQTGVGGCHGFIKDGTFIYDRGDNISCS